MIEDYILNFIHNSPISSLQILSGTTFYVADLLGVFPNKYSLFHPRLAFSPYWQTYRIGTSFLVMGYSIMDVIQRSAGIVVWQAPLEVLLNGKGDTFLNGKCIERGKQRQSSSSSSLLSSLNGPKRRNLFEWLVTENKFLKLLGLSALTLISLDLLTFSPAPYYSTAGKIGKLSRMANLIRPYSMYPGLEYSMRWLWSFTEKSSTIMLFNTLPLKPVYVPMVFALIGGGGFQSLKLMLKGLISALIVSKMMDLKRPDGQSVVSWFYEFSISWFDWLKIVGKNGLGSTTFSTSKTDYSTNDNQSTSSNSSFTQYQPSTNMNFSSLPLFTQTISAVDAATVINGVLQNVTQITQSVSESLKEQ